MPDKPPLKLEDLPSDEELEAGMQKEGMSATWTGRYIRELNHWRRRALTAEGAIREHLKDHPIGPISTHDRKLYAVLEPEQDA